MNNIVGVIKGEDNKYKNILLGGKIWKMKNI